MQPTAPNANQRVMIARRGLDPDDYLVVKVLNYVVILKHRHTGAIKFIDKRS